MTTIDELTEFLDWWCKDVPVNSQEYAKRNCRAYLHDGTATHRLTDAWAAWQARAAKTAVPPGSYLEEAVKHFEQAACHETYKMRDGVAAVLRYAQQAEIDPLSAEGQHLLYERSPTEEMPPPLTDSQRAHAISFYMSLPHCMDSAEAIVRKIAADAYVNGFQTGKYCAPKQETA